ncbi:flagellar basal-body MS-ring/collar protein FliF [Planococcus kocurii]|uniref:Flagellar M-ring protein n=1 Tax=Planococcus kocurii TaxID=1374 RepID=A0ABM5X096_9BACL|nr:MULTISPECIES: flagellar basal-body MS-ring/collar protein FliF [Planococcus]ALS80027.1 flagellar MS-ring protein [Planococcus kocurii]KAA0957450.1 flagellar M-ring protein FliF [Planococcus sp. ANT_H30]
MKEKLLVFKTKMSESWTSFSPVTKWSVIGSFFITLMILGIFVFFSNQSNFSVLYSDLTAAEAGEIKTAIEEQAIPVEVSADGKTISVPEEHLANLKVSLAAEGIPKNGNVNYGTFSENMGLGMTDRHFDVVERDAMQNELAYLIEQIDGVTEANVMITLPKENIWITDEEQTSTASIVVQGDSTLQLDQKQINGLYHLISKSVPSLPPEQIVIMDQNGQVFEVQDANQADTNLSVYQQHREIQKGIEQDIQRELQQMLGLLLGQDKVVVSVMTNIDFTKEKREEQLVEPVDVENNEGLDISVERIVETYSSEGTVIEDAAGTGETEVANYPGVDGAGNSESERTEERINSEVNRINRQIEKSPYVVDDITINVGVEPPIPDNPASLTQENIADISNLLKNAVSTSLSMNEFQATDVELEDRISVFATEFQGRPAVEDEKPEVTFFAGIPNNLLLVIGAAIVLVIVIIVALLFLRRKKKVDIEEEEYSFEGFEQALAKSNLLEPEEEEIDLSEFSNRSNPKRKTIEKLAKGRPEDFTKLLRSWMADD